MDNILNNIGAYANRVEKQTAQPGKTNRKSSEDSVFRQVMNQQSGEKDDQKRPDPAGEQPVDTSSKKPADEKPALEQPGADGSGKAEEPGHAQTAAAMLLAAMGLIPAAAQKEQVQTGPGGENTMVQPAAEQTKSVLTEQMAGGENSAQEGKAAIMPEEVLSSKAQETGAEKQAAVSDGKTDNSADNAKSLAQKTPQTHESAAGGQKTIESHDEASKTGKKAADADGQVTKQNTGRKQMTDSEARFEAQSVGQFAFKTDVVAAADQPVHMAVKSGEDLRQQILDLAEQMKTAGKRELEIELEPANLGKIVIKVMSDQGGTRVSLLCSESRTLNLLSERAADMGAILESRLGGDTVIYVEQQAADYLNQGRDEAGQGQKRDQEQKDPSKERKDEEEPVDFVSRLRLQMMQGLGAGYQLT